MCTDKNNDKNKTNLPSLSFHSSSGAGEGKRVFLELGHFDKHSPTTQERKAPQGKNLRFFRLETLKIFILSEKIYA